MLWHLYNRAFQSLACDWAFFYVAERILLPKTTQYKTHTQKNPTNQPTNQPNKQTNKHTNKQTKHKTKQNTKQNKHKTRIQNS